MSEPQQKKLLELSTAVRRRPGMFFGTDGSAAVPRMTRGVIDAILSTSATEYSGPITVSVAGKARQQNITVEFGDLHSSPFPPTNSEGWIEKLLGIWEVAAVAGASNSFGLETCDGERWARLEIRNGFRVSTKMTRSTQKPVLRVCFRPHVSTFKYLSRDDLYSIAGNLRDLSLLRPGKITQFRADALKGELSYFFEDGLRSCLFEDDYARWPLHPGCLSFQASSKGMSVEGHLRFLHAGVPCVRNYVNFHPTQGGAHLEGLGAALCELFPESSRGCRHAPLVTNPDTGTKIEVPHTFIGAMHVRVAEPRFYGPTRDVLSGEDVREFVRLAAAEPLKRQWRDLRG